VKGMLLWHSVGTGKTCSAIAAASKNFEPEGYTILWVTRTTLKNDIWKNMFEQVCNESLRQRLSEGKKIPVEAAKRMKLLSKAWSIQPMSYKQFSNLVSKNNQFYNELVKRNGAADPLRKTLLIIDEAHKLYGGNDLSAMERPDMKKLKQAIMHSYTKSGKDSVRLLLMTATPMTESPMELIKLLNLCIPPKDQMPESFDLFAEEFLKEDGSFTEEGKKKYMDRIAGSLSYLNREFDIRQFAQPKIEMILSPIANENHIQQTDYELNAKNIAEEKKRTQEELNKIKENPLFNLTQKHFVPWSNKCETVGKTKKAQGECKREIKVLIEDALKKIQKYKEEVIEAFERENQIKNEVDIRDKTYNKSVYYMMLTKCRSALAQTEGMISKSALEALKKEKSDVMKRIKEAKGDAAALDSLKKKKEMIEKKMEKLTLDIKNQKEETKRNKTLKKTEASNKAKASSAKEFKDIENMQFKYFNNDVDKNVGEIINELKQQIDARLLALTKVTTH
jgi:hypothetical protein